MQPQAELVLSSIRFAYDPGGWALEIPTLKLGTESVCGIIGPNGSGKSTLLKVAAGLLAPCEGDIRLGDDDLRTLRRPAIARRLGYLPQEVPSLFDYTVEQVAAMGRHAYGAGLDLADPEDARAVNRALEAVALDDRRQRTLSRLSGGERRRAWIASALAQEPEILLLDEPTQSLDPHQAVHAMGVLAERAANGLRVVAVLHDLNLASQFCDRLILMNAGKPVADGSPSEILTRERLQAVYGRHLDVFLHPETSQPVIWAKK